MAAPPPPAPATSTADWRAKTFDVLADATKQMITVAAGVVTASVIFSRDLTPAARVWALVSWVILTASIIFGCFVLFNIAGQLFKAANDNSILPTIKRRGIRQASILQIFSFVTGIVCLFIFGYHALQTPSSPPASNAITVTCVAPKPEAQPAAPAHLAAPPLPAHKRPK